MPADQSIADGLALRLLAPSAPDTVRIALSPLPWGANAPSVHASRAAPAHDDHRRLLHHPDPHAGHRGALRAGGVGRLRADLGRPGAVARAPTQPRSTQAGDDPARAETFAAVV